MDKSTVFSVLQIMLGVVVICLCCYSLYDMLAGKDVYSVCTQSCRYAGDNVSCNETCSPVNVTCRFVSLVDRVCTPDYNISGVPV